jgi:hypothetical protein
MVLSATFSNISAIIMAVNFIGGGIWITELYEYYEYKFQTILRLWA